MSGPVEILRRLRNDETDDAETTAALAKSLIDSGKISSAGAEGCPDAAADGGAGGGVTRGPAC